MIKKVIYYRLDELDNSYGLPLIIKPFNIGGTFKDFLDDLLGATYYPSVQTNVNDSNVKKLWTSVVSKYFYHAIVKMILPFDTPESYLDTAEYTQLLLNEYKKWVYKYLSLLDETSTYYLPLLKYYDDSANKLMDDIKATSKNAVKFNDTPQNPNTGGAYEGDNYITHYTSTEGENSSPLMSKMMRLKEIQDNYRNLMSQWVKDFERIYYQEEA